MGNLWKYRVKMTDPAPKKYMGQMMAVITAIPANGKVDISAPQAAAEDVRPAVKLVRSRAAEWPADPSRSALWAFRRGRC